MRIFVLEVDVTLFDIERRLFSYCYETVEQFRKDRADNCDGDRRLRCDNVVVDDTGTNSADTSRAIHNVHWMLKCLFTSKGIVFGKFLRNVDEIDRLGRPVPAAPNSFISIRTLSPAHDRRFFTKAPLIWEDSAPFLEDTRPIFAPKNSCFDDIDAERYRLAKELSTQMLGRIELAGPG